MSRHQLGGQESPNLGPSASNLLQEHRHLPPLSGTQVSNTVGPGSEDPSSWVGSHERSPLCISKAEAPAGLLDLGMLVACVAKPWPALLLPDSRSCSPPVQLGETHYKRLMVSD